MNTVTKKFLTTSEAAQRISIPEGSLNNMAWKKTGPKFYKVGKRRLYFTGDLDAFVMSNPVLTADQRE